MSASNSRTPGQITRRSRAKTYKNRALPANNSKYVTKAALHGGKFSPATNPPDVSYQPWWPITLVKSEPSGFTIKVKDICDGIRLQTDPNKRGFNQADSTSTKDTAFRMQIRIISISAWNLSGRMIALSVEDFTDSNTASGGRDQLCGIVDTGNVNHTPSAGYKLPATVSAHVLRNDDKGGELAIFETQAASGDIIVAYVSILFRFDGPVKIPTVADPIMKQLEEGNKMSKDSLDDLEVLNKTLDKLRVTIDKLAETRPGTTSKIIDGVATLAAYVVPLAIGKHSAIDNQAKTAIAVERNKGLDEPFVEL